MTGVSQWKEKSRFTLGVKLRQECVLSPLLFIVYLYELDRQTQPSWRGCHCRKLQNQPFAFWRRFGTSYTLWTRSSTCTWTLCSCVRPSRLSLKLALKSQKISSKKAEVLSLSKTPSKRQYAAAGEESSSTLGWYSRVTEGRTRRLIYRFVNQTQLCVNLSLCIHKMGAFKHRKAVSP